MLRTNTKLNDGVRVFQYASGKWVSGKYTRGIVVSYRHQHIHVYGRYVWLFLLLLLLLARNVLPEM